MTLDERRELVKSLATNLEIIRDMAYQAADLKQYCEIKRDVLVSLDVLGNDGEMKRLETINGQIEAYQEVLRRIG